MIEVEQRPSPSPHVARVWRAHAREVETMTSVANSMWELVLWNEGERLLFSVRGPETVATTADVPQDSRSLGILFAHGVHMPHLPASSLVDSATPPAPVRGGTLRLAGRDWPLPAYDTADLFVERLVAEGVLVRDPLVAAVLDGLRPALSARTVQRRVAATTGLTLGTIRQISRAREAARRLGAGTPILDVVEQLEYYDQPHLARSLTKYIGRTATQLARGSVEEPLSLVVDADGS